MQKFGHPNKSELSNTPNITACKLFLKTAKNRFIKLINLQYTDLQHDIPKSTVLKAAKRSSVPKLASKLPNKNAKTLQTPPTAQLTLIEACQHTNRCLLAV